MQITEPTLFSALEQGTLSFAYGVSPELFGLFALLIVAAVWLSYYRTTRPLSPGWKAWFIGLRSAVLILILFCLLRPVVNIQQVSPQDTYLAVLLDNSQSMSIADAGGRTRLDAVTEEILDGSVLEELAESFQLRTFAFDQSTRRVGEGSELGESGTGSAIGQALEAVADQLDGLPLGGLVLVSDGADNSNVDPLIAAQEFGNSRIPVFTVGVGQEDIPLDIGIVDVSAARTVLEGSVFTVSAALRHQGFAGQEVEVAVMDGESSVSSDVVTLGAEGVSQRVSLEVEPERAERIVYDLRVEVQPGEIIEQNNSYSFLVDNTDKPPLDVLYIEGHPRNEYKFIRRALEDDESLRLATYLQTGPEKFYRQGIESPTELAEGFPRGKDVLYEYEAIILGDIEQEFFNDDQLQMIEGFVAERGGGLLKSGMVDEEFIGTPLVDILPVTLVEEGFLPTRLRGGIRRGDHPTGNLFRPRLTRNGEFSPLLRLAGEDSDNLFAWSQLPDLQGVYVTGRIKPGAEVLLEHPALQFQNQALPVIVTQRYGSGRVISLTTASTWRWQMMMHSEDQSHETLWRQMLRWLAVSARTG
ncbi:MAG: VWA domain-containing protein [Gammaproteobacteria bacterium]|nr:VWA domain-containing protein [Gammaproteobacteria bacterium]